MDIFFKRKRVRHRSSEDLQKFAPRFRSLNRVILWTATCYFSCLLEPCFYFFLVGSILKMQFLEDPLDMLRHPTALRLQHTSQFTNCKFPIPTYYTTSCNPTEYISANVLHLTCSEPKINGRTESHSLSYIFQLHDFSQKLIPLQFVISVNTKICFVARQNWHSKASLWKKILIVYFLIRTLGNETILD